MLQDLRLKLSIRWIVLGQAMFAEPGKAESFFPLMEPYAAAFAYGSFKNHFSYFTHFLSPLTTSRPVLPQGAVGPPKLIHCA